MKEQTGTRRKNRIIAAVCAVVAAGGGTAGALALHARSGEKPETTQRNAMPVSADAADNGTISAGGTVESEQFGDDLGLVNTNVRLTVEAVLAESGDTVTAGTPLYQITEDSLAKAEKTLRSELQSAENALIQQKVSYQEEQGKASVLFKSEQLLGGSTQQTYNNALAELDSSFQQAYSDYMEALDTIGNTPSEVSAKQAELDAVRENTADRQAERGAAQQALDEAKADYSAAADSFNSAAAEYNAAAGVVRYLGNALGQDTSGITLAQTVSAAVQTQSTGNAAEQAETPAFSGGFDMESGAGGMMPDAGRAAAPRQGLPQTVQPAVSAEEDAASETLRGMYADALAEYERQKARLDKAETAFRDAESAYQSCADYLTECEAALKEAQSSASALEKEISSLNSTLSKARSNLSKLRSEYNSLKASYETDQLELKHTLDTDTAAGENAEYHYEITCATIEDDLAQAQSAYDAAAENVRIFEENLAEGYVCAKQDGIIYSLNCQEGRSVNLNTSYVSYVDESSYYTTVELDQNDVTQVNIGDSVLIYSSETGTINGTITAIAAGESTSLADVRFNVTVTAGDDANLYSGESVNVYFNAGDLKQSDFRDFDGGENSERQKPSSDGERPDFGGGMPEGFDPSNMPDFGRRKDD